MTEKLYLCSLLLNSFIYSCIHSFIHCVILSFLPSSMHLFIHIHIYLLIMVTSSQSLTHNHSFTTSLTITHSPPHSPSHQLTQQHTHQLSHCRLCSQPVTRMWTLTLCAYCAIGHGAVCEDGRGSGGAGSHPGGGHVLPVSEWQRHHAGLCHCPGRAACQECPHTAYQVSTTSTAVI